MTPSVRPTRIFTNEQLEAARQQGDPPADAVVATLVREQGPGAVRTLMPWLADNTHFDMTGQPEAIQQFFADFARLPAWTNPDQMRRGMAFYRRNAGAIGLILGTFSLPYTYLGANGVQLLWLTDRIRSDTARRLQETGEWVFAVNDPRNWPAPNHPTENKAILYTLKIRLIHAASRWFGLQSGRWQAEWGVPVCQEDMVGTIGSFSYIVLRGLRKMGVAMTDQEEMDYLHHINVVGFINGVADDLLPRNLREAFHLDRLIVQRQFRPSEAGTGLTKALLDAIGKQAGSDSARNLAAAQMRFFLGPDHATALGIPDVPAETRLMSVVSRLPIFPKLIPNQVQGLKSNV